MPNRDELLALADRVEALDGPNMHVDRVVRDAFGQPNDYAADWGPRDGEVFVWDDVRAVLAHDDLEKRFGDAG